MSMADVQQVLSQITQLQAELQALSSRVDVLSSSIRGSGFDTEVGAAGGGGAEWSKPGFIDTIGGNGDLIGTRDSGSETIQGSLRFKAASDSNVVVKTKEENEESCDGTIEIGVYYK